MCYEPSMEDNITACCNHCHRTMFYYAYHSDEEKLNSIISEIKASAGQIRTCNHSPRIVRSVFEKPWVKDTDYWNQFASRSYHPTFCHGCSSVKICDCDCKEVTNILGLGINGIETSSSPRAIHHRILKRKCLYWCQKRIKNRLLAPVSALFYVFLLIFRYFIVLLRIIKTIKDMLQTIRNRRVIRLEENTIGVISMFTNLGATPFFHKKLHL